VLNEHEEHLTHVLHQLQNKPWAALYVLFIFYAYFNGCFSFYAIQKLLVAVVLFRVMQGITAYLPVGSILFLYFNYCGLHF
jgi:hypothetical protein